MFPSPPGPFLTLVVKILSDETILVAITIEIAEKRSKYNAPI
jgi:hypothetical protein